MFWCVRVQCEKVAGKHRPAPLLFFVAEWGGQIHFGDIAHTVFVRVWAARVKSAAELAHVTLRLQCANALIDLLPQKQVPRGNAQCVLPRDLLHVPRITAKRGRIKGVVEFVVVALAP